MMSRVPVRKVVDFPDPGRIPDSAPSPAGRLESWKEIASYLNRGTRTVQRWEAEEGLPVHRLRHDQGSTVHAYKSELDAWWSSRQAVLEDKPPASKPKVSEASVAVLPFADMSQEKDQEYFCEGIAEEIINALSKISSLRVASRTAAFQSRSTTTDIREIGRRLGVRALLEGSVRKSGNRLRIAVHLTDAATGYQLWAERYERELRDIFAIQDEIARSIVQALQVTLTPEESGALRRNPTSNIQAYDYYLRGRQFFYHYSRRDIEFAIQLFSKAIELDPAFVLAHAGLADCWSFIYLYSRRTDEARLQADATSYRAVELDPESAPAQAARAVAHSINRRDTDAEHAFERAIRLDPNLFEAYYFYARHAFVCGETEKAVHLYEQAMRVRPEDYQAPLLVAQSYEALGRPEDARAARESGIRLAEQHLALTPDDARALYMAANGLAALGMNARACEFAGRALALQPDEPMLLFNIGCIFALLGLIEEALDVLERAARTGLTQKAWYEHDSNLDSLRPHPRFQTLLRSL